MFALLFGLCGAEIFDFSKPGETMSIKFRLDSDNINTGFFRAEPGSNLTYRVEITTPNRSRTLYKMNKLEEDKETHFSFNNTEELDVDVHITAIPIDPSKKALPGSCQMKFESAKDTFNKEVSKREQIEPAIYALEHILKKLKDVTNTSRMVSNNIGTLGQENRKMLSFVVIFSFISLASYTAFNIAQLYYMKKYLNERKYL